MPLIKCPECGAQVSSHAESCPKCAYPIAGGGSTQAHGGKISTIEKTSKQYKLQLMLSLLLSIGSVVVMVAGVSENEPSSGAIAFGAIGLLFGMIWFTVVRFSIWWHHMRMQWLVARESKLAPPRAADPQPPLGNKIE